MQCARCQHENRPGAKFCEECATPLATACARCGAPLSPTAKFCSECAHPAGQAVSLTAARSAAPEAYTPKHLAEKILTSKTSLEGERKQVTVLFADLKGSMELLANRDPEEARKILDPVLERMMEAVHRYEGTVNQVMGDGIMALFGAPLAHEDHAVRACYAALRMQESVKRYAEDARRVHGVNVLIRVGLNSGEVVVRAIGSDLHMDYTAVGQTTHLAARMEQFASPGSILLTASTVALVEGYVAVKPLGPVPVKGLSDAVEVSEVTGAGPARTRLQAAARRGLTRFVGRATEVEQLRRAQKLAGSGHGQVTAIIGEAGVGKSRLIYEFTHSHRLQGWLVLESASVSYGKAMSYLPMIDLLKGYFKIQDRDDLREIREKVTGKLLTLDEALKPTLPALLALLDVPVDDASWSALDPAERRQRTLDGAKRLLLREAREQPLVVIFEDLHWIDSETQALLDTLVDSLGSVRLLLLVTYRPDYQHTWGSRTSYSQMRLDALQTESAAEMLDALLGDDVGLDPLKQLLVKRGNPFFLEETVRTLVETKALIGEGGRYRLTQPLQASQVPPTVQAVLAARIDRLPPDDKRLLQVASVVGKDVPFALLQGIADVPEEALHRGLDHLQAAEFLYETELYPDLEYSFKHALTHEVAYGGLLLERRRDLHARILEAVERLHQDRLAEHVERLAHHATHGEVWEKALAYLRQSGAKAFARSAFREAKAYFEQALVAAQHLPESSAESIDLRLDLRNTLIALGEFEAMFDHLRAAETLAEAVEDKRRLGWVSAYLSPYFSSTGDQDRAIETGQRALAIATASRDFALEVMATFFLGLPYISKGDYRQATRYHRRDVEILTGESLHERFGEPGLPAVFSRAYLVWGLAELGAFADGRARCYEAMQLAETVNQPFTLSHACWGSGFLSLRQGDFPEAIAMLERTLDVCRTGDVQLVLPWAASALGYAYALVGRLEEALPLLEEATSKSTAMNQMVYFPLWVTHLSEAYLLAGRLEKARQLAGQALTLARDLKQRGHEAYALRLLGEFGAHGDPTDVEHAGTSYRRALALAEDLGMRPLVAHCHLGLGKLYQRTGKRHEAQEHLTTATTMYRDMDMRYWLEQAETAMTDLA